MALSTRAKLAGLGGALALGVLGATGVAYAADGTATPQYVTTVDDGTPDGSQQAPAPSEGQRSGDREDCPERSGGSGGSGEGGTSPAPAPSQSGSTDGAADA